MVVFFVNGILKVIFVYAVVCCVTSPLLPTQTSPSLFSFHIIPQPLLYFLPNFLLFTDFFFLLK